MGFDLDKGEENKLPEKKSSSGFDLTKNDSNEQINSGNSPDNVKSESLEPSGSSFDLNKSEPDTSNSSENGFDLNKPKEHIKTKNAHATELVDAQEDKETSTSKSKILKPLLFLAIGIVVVLLFLFVPNTEDKNFEESNREVDLNVSQNETISDLVEDDANIDTGIEESPILVNGEIAQEIDLIEDAVDEIIIDNNITKVENKIASNSTDLTSKTIDEKVQEVIRGVYGNGNERMDALGTDYRVIQDKVNEMYKNSAFTN